MTGRPLAALAALAAFAVAQDARAEDARADADAGFARVAGAVVSAGFGTSRAGDALLFGAGGESAGLRVLGRRFTLAWDVVAEGRFGWLGNAHPFLSLVGVHAGAKLEGGWRVLSARSLSPWVGVRAAEDALAMAHPGLSFDRFDTINEADGVGGRAFRGALRLAAGLSEIGAGRSLIAFALLEEQLDGPTAYTPSRTFTLGGIGARLDTTSGWAAGLEGALGASPARRDPRGLMDQTVRVSVTASARKTFGGGFFLGLAASIARDTDHLAYAGGLSYDTADPPAFSATLTFGVPVWRLWRRP